VETNAFPEFRQLGYLSAFKYDATAQTLEVGMERARRVGEELWEDFSADFTGVCYARTQTDLPLYLNETEIHLLGEFSPSELELLQEKEGWLFLVLPFGTSTIGSPARERPRFRYFKLGSSMLSCDWLCTGVTVRRFNQRDS
jgi:hypothetical protein